jgi:hypothetical protein
MRYPPCSIGLGSGARTPAVAGAVPLDDRMRTAVIPASLTKSLPPRTPKYALT